jgi:hypothetical protein
MGDGNDQSFLINKYLNKKYSSFYDLISREYANRIGRPGGIVATKCSGFEIQREVLSHF